MNNPYLLSKVCEVQSEYKELLQGLKNVVSSNDFRYAIDEIGLFWFRKRHYTELILNYISDDSNAYFLAGGSYLDISCNEHYPFSSLGSIHIIDDPLAKFSETIKSSFDESTYFLLKEEIIASFYDDLEILENYNSIFILLPLTCFAVTQHLPKEFAENALLSFFKDGITIDQLFSVKDFSNLHELISTDAERFILFSDNDKPQDSIEVKFNNFYVKHGNLTAKQNVSFAQQSVLILLQDVLQALHILLIAFTYNIIPYIRSHVVHNYVTFFSPYFQDMSSYKNILVKSSYASLFYRLYNTNEISRLIDFKSYYQKINRSQPIDFIYRDYTNVTLDLNLSKEIQACVINDIKKLSDMFLESPKEV